MYSFHNKASFYDEELLAPHPTPKLEDHPLSAVRNCLFNIFAATLHIGGRSSIHNLRTCHTMGTGTHISWEKWSVFGKNGLGIWWGEAEKEYREFQCE